jgi:hypothetical protein
VPTQASGKNLFCCFLTRRSRRLSGRLSDRKPLVTDDRGRVTLPMPWAGRYVLEVTYFDEKPGSSGEEKFSRIRYISSLSFIQQTGLRWTDKA